MGERVVLLYKMDDGGRNAGNKRVNLYGGQLKKRKKKSPGTYGRAQLGVGSVEVGMMVKISCTEQLVASANASG